MYFLNVHRVQRDHIDPAMGSGFFTASPKCVSGAGKCLLDIIKWLVFAPSFQVVCIVLLIFVYYGI